MCGIVGIFSPQRAIDTHMIRKMNDAIVRRGPDDEGYYENDSIALGMRRLSIIDLSNGHQPIFNEDNTVVIVFNGEIYNHAELRDLLINKGHTFKTKSDTEVIVHLYEEYGIHFLDYLRGMFGICIWDIKQQKGFLCRDHFGIKPIFTSIDAQGRLIFGSELKSVLASNLIEKKISLQGLDAYFAYNYIPAPLTIYQHIFKLPAAHYIEFSSKGISEPIKYWEANDIKASTYSDEKLTCEIEDSIRHHMESDVPVGAFLSGGIDSSLVTAMASSHPNFEVAYTVGFDNVTRVYDERPLAQLVAQRYHIKKHNLSSIDPQPESLLPEAVLAFDEPFADDSVFPTWEICKLAAQDVKVCLTGLGGDELFAGYYRYQGIYYHQLYSRVPLVLRKLILAAAKIIASNSGSRKVDHMMRFLNASVLDDASVYSSYITALSAEKRAQLYHSTISDQIDYEASITLTRAHFERCNATSLVKKAIYCDIHTYVPEDILCLSDRVSMWHSLELRVPLMDKILFTYAYGLSDALKISFTKKKIALRKIAQAFLPEALFKAKKQGFESPMAEWINGKLASYIDNALSEESLAAHNLFNADAVRKLLNEHRHYQKDNSKILFSLIMFQAWYKGAFQ